MTLRKILLDIKDPAKTLSWILVSIFLPILGIFLYQLIGTSVKKDAFFTKKKPRRDTEKDRINASLLPPSKLRMVELLSKNKSSNLSYGNSVTVLRDGSQTMQEIVMSMKKAKSHIHLDFYIVESGKMLDAYIKVISEKTKEGVSVRLIYDGLRGNGIGDKCLEELKKAGVEIKVFMPFNIFKSIRYINYRNHRKIILIDNEVAFTGGMNISDNYLDDDNELGFWKDTFIKIEGRAAADLEYIFNCDWHYAGGQQYELPAINYIDKENIPIQILSSGPDSEHKGIMQQYFTFITDAEDYIYISTPYFIPGEAIITALKTAALSGIDVKIMLPIESDSKWLKWCMFTYLEDLLSAGVEIFLYKAGFLHSKVMISDDIVSSVGTANVDERSFEANFEVNAIVYDKRTSEQLKEFFFADIKNCERLNLTDFSEREDRNKIMESIARLASPML
jgi:cardiolipin synthase